MADWPAYGPLDLFAGQSISTCAVIAPQLNTAPTSTAWPGANLALFVPFTIAAPVTVYKMVMGCGATAAGNYDMGIYDSDGDRLVSSGSRAKPAASEDVADVTDTQLGPGLFYLAVSADGTNNYQLITPPGSAPVPAQKLRLWGVLQMGGAFPLPAVATLAASTASVLPNVGAYLRPY